MESNFNLFGEPVQSTSPINSSLVYRKPHKSVNQETEKNSGASPRSIRSLDIKEFISITPSRIVKYARNVSPNTIDYTQMWLNRGAKLNPDGTLDKSNMLDKLTSDNKTHGLISKKGGKNINLAVDWMVLLANEKESFNPKFNSRYKWKLNFITLTLSSKQVHSDKEIITKVFQPFLDYLRKNYSIKNYFWRAETQSNGNLHLHLCLDVFVPWMLLRNRWNFFQNKLGYIDVFEKKNNHNQPNSTDIHSLKNIKKIGAYLSKYCGKNAKGITVLCTKSICSLLSLPHCHNLKLWTFPPKKVRFFRQVHCKLWGCSQNISKLKKCRVCLNDLLSYELLKIKNSKLARVVIHDYATTIFFDVLNLKPLGCNNFRDVLWRHIISILNPIPT